MMQGPVLIEPDLRLSPDATCEEAFRAISTHCAAATDSALAVFLETDEESGPHKARVALRRLTTCLDAFAPILQRKRAAALRKRAKHIFRALGEVRDSDVYLARRQDRKGHMTRLEANLRLRTAMRVRLRKEKAVAFPARLVAAVQPGAALFRDSGKGLVRRQGPVTALALAALDDAWAQCRSYGNRVGKIAPDDLHEFRKDMKSLRYLADFFTDLYPGLDQAPFRDDFRIIQDSLGLLNDARVAAISEGRKAPTRLSAEDAAALATAETAWSRLCAAPLPWR